MEEGSGFNWHWMDEDCPHYQPTKRHCPRCFNLVVQAWKLWCAANRRGWYARAARDVAE